MPDPNNILSLDIGEKRIGVAMSSLFTRLPSPLTTLQNDRHVLQALLELVQSHNVAGVVVGLPRGLKGLGTPQTMLIRDFIDLLRKKLSVPLYIQDEDLTSVKAKNEFHERGVRYNKESVDALAATYILEDFLREHPEVK